nr:F-box/LRR-repeat protein 4-like isoform X1 [Procambarus clarkii]XP_045611771.1 F-box/LRR-repeat protein 4-like isoform X1 [Procambarus clarkii]XP_045611772.1 F-box/LRR-repeat protein 4-like isoform X1 [Procambarus clarkii]
MGKTQCVLDQYVKEVGDFSSQYGSDGSISYVANNIIGKPTLYPEYGDFSSAYCLRSYGKWWTKCESAITPIEDPRPLLPPSVDFIDVRYECPVYPIRVDFYETYHPGSVVRVWGSLEGQGWILLWSGEPQTGLKPIARIFSPPIRQPNHLVNLLRIEFDQQHQTYYSALDSILLVGSTHTASKSFVATGDSITSQVLKLGLHTTMCEQGILAGVQFLLSQENLQKLVAEEPREIEDLLREEKADVVNMIVNEEQSTVVHVAGDTSTEVIAQAVEDEGTSGGYFELLPEELILYILRQVDIRSLCRLSHTCKLLQKYASEPCLYMRLNLKNCWWLVKNSTLECLSSRCSLLQALDLSWCGPYNALDTETFMEFIHTCGRQLTILRLNNCHFIDNYCLYMIANVCLYLEELSMANCSKVDHLGFGELKKAWALSRLDLSRTRIDFHTLQLLLQHASQLRHLSLNNCTQLDMDEVALTLATFNRGLISLSAWKTHGITTRGFRALACIPTLQDLDLGWALSGAITEGLGELVRGCKGLRRLYLTALRTLTDHDLHQLTTHAGQLTQLDIMGTRNVTPEAVQRLLHTCQNLELLDVGFCEQIHSTVVHQWILQFPKVSIKGGLWHQEDELESMSCKIL